MLSQRTLSDTRVGSQTTTAQYGSSQRQHAWDLPLSDQSALKRKHVDEQPETINSTSNPVRRRISRACDKCNQLRTKCDGSQPCKRCLESNFECKYARLHKKRGRAPKKEHSQDGSAKSSAMASHRPGLETQERVFYGDSVQENAQSSTGLRGFSFPKSVLSFGSAENPRFFLNPVQGAFPVQRPDTVSRSDDNSGTPAETSPSWSNNPSPNFADFRLPPAPGDGLRYPVLRPLLPLVEGIIPYALACDLLEVYFLSSSSALLRPSSPHILGYIFRKKSILHPTAPRPCNPSLLASMLWIAAQTSNATALSSQPTARGRICRRLLELTVDLLKPLIHAPVPGGTSLHGSTNHVIDDVSLGVLGVSTEGDQGEGSMTAQVDILATYIHLATIMSASERKAASLRWWNAAWALANELKFGREVSEGITQYGTGEYGADLTAAPSNQNYGRDERHSLTLLHTRKFSLADSSSVTIIISEEQREERRRTWWLLYMMDRHLALCYNRPLALLDRDCSSLFQPVDDSLWQSTSYESTISQRPPYRHVGPSIACTGPSIFGYFLPAMTILGRIVDLNMSQSRPVLVSNFQISNKFDDDILEINQQLEVYGQSLRDLENQTIGSEPGTENFHSEAPTPSVKSVSTTDSHFLNESVLQLKTAIAYGRQLMHVLSILRYLKWDPIMLLEDRDLWISTESFVTATDHALAAAEAIGSILELDPDLTFMPFFLGIYLLQGSFLLLLFADKLQGDVSENLVRACETVIRAHEASVVTLDTLYQRNFRKVMRSALSQGRGRMVENLAEQQQWRREVLSLYRWTGDGTGLAL